MVNSVGTFWPDLIYLIFFDPELFEYFQNFLSSRFILSKATRPPRSKELVIYMEKFNFGLRTLRIMSIVRLLTVPLVHYKTHFVNYYCIRFVVF